MLDNNYQGPERRFYKRLPANLGVEFVFMDTSQDKQIRQFEAGYTVDISGGGMALELDRLEEDLNPKLFSGAVRIGLKFELPDNQGPIFAFGKAVWVTKESEKENSKSKYIVGLQFVDITEKDRDRIIKFVVTSYLKDR